MKTHWDLYKDKLCPYCGGEHHYWDCEIFLEESFQQWRIARGATPDLWPTLWACTNCKYSYWSFGKEQDPDDDNHCSGGYWVADRKAIWV